MRITTFVLIFFSCVAFLLSGYNLYLVFTHPIKFENYINFYAEEFDLNPALVASVINVESSYNVKARSNKNAIGLMQIKLTTANYLNTLNEKNLIEEKELFNPNINIKFGCEYLRYLMNKFENLTTVLASYNAGETRVKTWLKSSTFSDDGKTLKNIPYLETKNYINKINKNIAFYEKIFKKI